MSDSARIALLGRAGEAREQLGQALAALGAEIVVAGDPGELTPDSVRALNPSVLVVSLDAAMEDQLERWDGLLDDPSINVVFDEAEVTRSLGGWDLARWARHLASKILPRSSLLPPAPADAQPLPAPAKPAAPGPAPIVEAAPEPAIPEVSGAAAVDADLDPGEFDLDPAAFSAEPEPAPAEDSLHDADEAPEASDFSFDPDLASLEAALAETREDDASNDGVRGRADDGGGIDDDLSALLAQFDDPVPADAPVEAAAEEAAFDWTLPESGGQVAAEPEDAPAQPGAMNAEPAAGEAAQAGKSALFANLELVPLDDAATPVRADQPASTRPADIEGPAEVPLALSLDDLVAGMGLADDAGAGPMEDVAGAIVLIAGVGGPDAVRQCLGALPARLPVPVIVWQHLDAANHDRLVPQMARASHVPVYLAEAGDALRSGQVAVLPNGTGIDLADPASPRFQDGAGGPVDGLRALSALGRDAVVIVLSGADPEIADSARAIAAQGGLLLAQDPATCFDGRAAAALHQAGAAIAAPAELAQRAVRHWSN